jgi:hypothetical protein
MNNLNGTNKPSALPAHQGTDKWFAMGDKLAEQPVPSTPNTRELATITARRARRAERIGIAAGLLTLAAVVLVSLLAHHRSAASGVPVGSVTAPPTAPAPVAPAEMPAAAPAPTVAAPAPTAAEPTPTVAEPAPTVAEPTPTVAAPAPTATVKAPKKHKKTARSTAAPRRH